MRGREGGVYLGLGYRGWRHAVRHGSIAYGAVLALAPAGGQSLPGQDLTPALPGSAALEPARPIAESAPQPTATDAPDLSDVPELIVIGDRRSIVTDVDPLATFDLRAIAATGATTVTELLRAIRGVTQSADGSDPIFLLNGQRTSGYQDIGTLPPEAIEKVEVMPEPVALRFGYPPSRRVVNFITKRRFRQTEVRGAGAIATRGAGSTGKANLGLTRLHDNTRLTVALEYRHTDPIFQSDRAIALDPAIPFDALGNVTGTNGGEIDPALSAAAGRIVAIAAVPDGAGRSPSIADFVAGANRPRVFDIGPYRTLAPGKDAIKAETVMAGRIGRTIAGSISLSAERSQERHVAGLAPVTLTIPATNAYSPFAGPVLLDRYLIEADALRVRQTTTTLHAGATMRGAVAGWRWDMTAALDQQRIDGRSDRGIDPTAANVAIANGADPFAPLDTSLLSGRLVDIARLRTRTGGAKLVATNSPVRLPAGEMTVTATAEAERAAAVSSTRGPNPFALRLGRTRVEGGMAIDLPLASRREDVLPFLGELSINGSATARHVGGFGALSDATYGTSWGPATGIQLLGSVRHSATAPAVAQQSTPELRLANVPVFDSIQGRTELVTMLVGGNRDLVAERRSVRSLTLNVKPFGARELRLAATYDATTIRNQTATVYALTPQTEAALPGLTTRDPDGRLIAVSYRPINIFRERQRSLNLTISAAGMVGSAPPPAKPDQPGKPDTRASFYAGVGPIIKLRDRLELRRGSPELDLLHGDTIIGNGIPQFSGYAYGGINRQGAGLTFDLWYGGSSRVRSSNPASDLRSSPILKVNLGGTIGLQQILKTQDWAQKLQLKIDVNNVTDARQRIRDANGDVPIRLQRDFLDPVGRMVTLTLRKLF